MMKMWYCFNADPHYIPDVIFSSYKQQEKFSAKGNGAGFNDLQYENSHKITDYTKRQERSGPNHTQSQFMQ